MLFIAAASAVLTCHLQKPTAPSTSASASAAAVAPIKSAAGCPVTPHFRLMGLMWGHGSLHP